MADRSTTKSRHYTSQPVPVNQKAKWCSKRNSEGENSSIRTLRPIGLVLLLFLMIPSAAYLCWHDDLPDFCGFHHDDCVYFVSAQSLAQGSGYRIETLPMRPAQTKYPPLYPLLLSLAWRIDPHFPHNLPIAAWLSWMAIPAALLAFSAYLPCLGVAGGRAWFLLSLFAFNAYIIWFGSQLLSDPLFLALTLAVLLMIEQATKSRHAQNWALVAGLGAGVAYLARTAGIALLPVAMLYLWRRAGSNAAWRFAAGMLPFLIAWSVWVSLHKFQTADPAITYYTDYVAYEFANVNLGNLPLILWKNMDGLLWALGSWILPKFTQSLLLKIAAQVIAVAMISGVVRMLRQGYGQLYAIFSLVYIAMLMVWHYPPDERFVLPMFPLALAGLLFEGEHVLRMLRRGLHSPRMDQRVTAACMFGVALLLIGGVGALQVYSIAVIQPANAHLQRLRQVQFLEAASWLRAHVPRDEAILANNDPALSLYTGNPAIRRPLLPRLWYAEDHKGLIDLWGNLSTFALEHELKYLFWFNHDATLPVSLEDLQAIEAKQQADPLLTQVYRNERVTIYRVGFQPRRIQHPFLRHSREMTPVLAAVFTNDPERGAEVLGSIAPHIAPVFAALRELPWIATAASKV